MKPKDWYVAILAGVLLGILIVAFQASGVLSQTLNVSAANSADVALTKTLQSYKTWSTLHGEARLVQYDANNKPQVDIVSVQISQPFKANVSFKQSDDKDRINFQVVADGKAVYELNNGNLSYTQFNLPSLTHYTKDLSFIPQTLADIKKDEAYGHPFGMLISSPIMEYIYPVWFPQARSGSIYKLLGKESIIGRPTWKVDLQTTTDHVIAWIDQATGIILKYSQMSGGQQVVSMQFVWIKIDQNINAQTFSAPDAMKYQQINTNP